MHISVQTIKMAQSSAFAIHPSIPASSLRNNSFTCGPFVREDASLIRRSFHYLRRAFPKAELQWQAQAPHGHVILSRRHAISWIAALPFALSAAGAKAAQAEKVTATPYDAYKSRRYIGIGRPAPDRAPPMFEPGKKLFSIDNILQAQDIRVGTGEEKVQPGTLVVARWSMLLDDGTIVDTSNEKQAAMFRPGAHQVPPGVEDAVVGMLPGGMRRIKGTSERVLANVVNGYDIGERSLVPNGSTLFIDIMVDRINPYGTGSAIEYCALYFGDRPDVVVERRSKIAIE